MERLPEGPKIAELPKSIDGQDCPQVFSEQVVLSIAIDSQSEPEGTEMNIKTKSGIGAILAVVIGVSVTPVHTAIAQESDELEEIIVTGSRIRRNPLNEAAAVMDIDSLDLERTGQSNLGTILQQLAITGSAINLSLNQPGNVGSPTDGSGLGAGAVRISLRNLGAPRTLVLVDGRRWIAGASATGVPVAVDLNSIPGNVIQRIEILQDGASAIYGSDAIAGVVNIITYQDFEGFKLDAYASSYLSEGDGESFQVAGLWGGGNDTTHFVVSASYTEDQEIAMSDRTRSAFPKVDGNRGNADATTCDVPNGRCSSFIPQGRFVLGENFPSTIRPEGANIVLNDGVLNDGMGNIPSFNAADPGVDDDFHPFTSDDLFNFNGPGFNFLKLPYENVNFYANVRHKLTDQVTMFVRGSYTNRSSLARAAPQTMGLFSGNDIAANFFISALNPYNPFGVDLSVANGNVSLIRRRMVESGPRIHDQDVNTYMFTLGLEGEFEAGGRDFYWDLVGSYGDNRAFQQSFNRHNMAKLQIAMGDPAICAATFNCVDFNMFGGQGPDGNGSFTQEMIDYVRVTLREFSEQTLKDFTFNISGDIASLPAGELAFAAGLEYRDHEGSYQPDALIISGDTGGTPTDPTVGGFDVTEYYLELSIPLIADAAAADLLEVNLAARNSDYSNFGSEPTYKISSLWRPIEDLSFRASFSTGIRAPGIGELFGAAFPDNPRLLDPCTDYTGILGQPNGRDTPQDAQTQANCLSLGVPVGSFQIDPGLPALSGGNPQLIPEESEQWMAGVVYSPRWSQELNWSEGMTISLDWYDFVLDDAIVGRPAFDVVTDCVATLDPITCAAVTRRALDGQITLIRNPLENIGGIDASGMDLEFSYLSPETGIGQFSLTLNATYLNEFLERFPNPDGTVSTTDRTGRVTDEAYQRAFPEWRAVTTLDWSKERWSGSLRFRWVDDMITEEDNNLDSVVFTDIRASYNPAFLDDALTVTLGFNNVLDEDPPVCVPCSIISMVPQAHDLPGVVGYLRVTYQP